MRDFKETEIGLIPCEWDLKIFSDLVDIIGGGTPKTTVQEYWNGQIPWLSVVDFNNEYKTVECTEKTISELGLKNSSTKILEKGDVIISARGTVGAIAQLGKDMAFNQSCYGLRAKENLIYRDFLYYLLKFSLNILKQSTHGSTFDTITKDTFDLLKVPFPSISEQKLISKTLSALDDKIELNQRMNQTLEEIGRAIFKHWFVDFEFPDKQGRPYKSSGGEMVDSELGEIPKGWEVGELGNFIQFKKGKKPKKVFKEKKDGYLPQILIDTFDGGNPVYAHPEKMVIAERNEPLMVMDGASSGRLERGYKGILGSTLSKITVKTINLSNYYLFYFLKIREGDINQNTTGTSIPHTDKERIKKYKVLIPKKETLQKFNIFSSRILDETILNKKEMKDLSQIRDSLLPKLMSGKIRVKGDE